MFLFVGLGNPGPDYKGNRHNIGFMAIEEIAESYGFAPFRSRFQGLVAEGRLGGQKVLALKPLTYMNESGRSVGDAVRFFKIPSDRVIVFYDEIDLVPGKVRVKRGGGAGGHNGIRSIDAHIGRDYWRVRLGVGHPGEKSRVKAYVLQDFAKAEREGWLPKLIEACADEADRLVTGDHGSFMSRLAHAVFPQREKPPKPANPPERNNKSQNINGHQDINGHRGVNGPQGTTKQPATLKADPKT